VTPEPSSILLTDQVAVVTGGGRGIGRAVATTFARFGAHVAVCDRVADLLDETLAALAATDRRVVGRVLDVRDAEARTEFVDEVVGELGRVDVLVNNAGGTFFAPFLEVSDKGDQTLWLENFGHVTSLVRAVVPHMPAGGAIVNVTSIEAHQAAPGFAVYAAMKAALAHLTRTLALELAPLGIRVNAIAPDAIPTGGDEALRGQMRAAGAVYDPAVVPPLGRMGEPDDAAAAAVFLASDLARFVTGTTVHVDGGNWAAGGWRRIAGEHVDGEDGAGAGA
jgi:NAD(P)-dependent dehydrogenase (short-subunit alcohol dehydrogenase family)